MASIRRAGRSDGFDRCEAGDRDGVVRRTWTDSAGTTESRRDGRTGTSAVTFRGRRRSPHRCPPERTDTELLAGDDPGDFEAFYVRNVDLVTRYVARRSPGPDITLDVVAETFARALEHRASYVPDRAPPGAWLLRIARNILIDASRRGRVADDTRRALRMQPIDLDDADLTAIHQRGSGSVLDALERLPEDQADAIRRRVLDGAPYEVVAASVGCSPQVARQRVHRGLRTLRRRTKEQNA